MGGIVRFNDEKNSVSNDIAGSNVLRTYKSLNIN
jgi:hypothetical protein